VRRHDGELLRLLRCRLGGRLVRVREYNDHDRGTDDDDDGAAHDHATHHHDDCSIHDHHDSAHHHDHVDDHHHDQLGGPAILDFTVGIGGATCGSANDASNTVLIERCLPVRGKAPFTLGPLCVMSRSRP
jgi:hypothetical protein